MDSHGRRKAFPFTDRLFNVFSTLGEKANAQHSFTKGGRIALRKVPNAKSYHPPI